MQSDYLLLANTKFETQKQKSKKQYILAKDDQNNHNLKNCELSFLFLQKLPKKLIKEEYLLKNTTVS